MSQSDSRPQQSQSNRHYEATCPTCGRSALVKSGRGCPYCNSSVQEGAEVTRKTFGSDDNDLIKGG